MTEDALAKAMEKKAVLAQRISQEKAKILDAQAYINRLSDEAAAIDDWIEMWHRLTGTPMNPTGAERIENTAKNPKQKRPVNPTRSAVVDAALEIIHERGKPQSRRALFDALVTRGFDIQGKDPEMVLSTMLWRSKDRIERLAPFGYWPAGEPYEPDQTLKSGPATFDL